MKTIGVGDVGLQRFNSRSSVRFKHFKNQASNSHYFFNNHILQSYDKLIVKCNSFFYFSLRMNFCCSLTLGTGKITPVLHQTSLLLEDLTC